MWLSHLSCAEESTSGCTVPGVVSPVQSKGAESLPSICWPHLFLFSPGYCWFSKWQEHIVGSCSGCHPPIALFSRTMLNPFAPQILLIVWGCCDPDAKLCSWLCWNLMRSTRVHCSSLCRSLWMASHPLDVSTVTDTLSHCQCH